MIRLPGRRSRAAAPAPLPDGWPDWLPVEGGHRGRDVLPTKRFWDLSRLFHRDPAGDADEGWPEPVRPGAEQRSLCDVRGRPVPAVPAASRPQAEALLASLGTDDGVHALLTGEGAVAEAGARGLPLVDGRHVEPGLAGQQVVLERDLTPDAAARLLTGDGGGDGDGVDGRGGGLLLLWSDTWLVRCDPGGTASSSLVAGVHGTAERLRQDGLDVLPIGHAYAWPPPCTTCDAAGTPHPPQA